MDEFTKKLDWVDIILALIAIAIIAELKVPATIIIAVPAWIVLVYLRKNERVVTSIQEQQSISRQRMTQSFQTMIGNIRQDKPEQIQEAKKRQFTPNEPGESTALVRYPEPFSWQQLGTFPPLTVPVGKIHNKGLKSISFQDVQNVVVAGTTGTGKDSLLRLWFIFLTKYNTPKTVQFAIIDGKGEWLLPGIAHTTFMFMEPVGGQDIAIENGKVINMAAEHMSKGIVTILIELQRRLKLFNEAGVVNITRYNEKTGNILPMIFVIVTDVGTDLEKDLSLLINILATKGRSVGFRLIMSMQSTANQNTLWRGNIGLILTGKLLPTQDNAVLGIPVDAMTERPSSLPTPVKTKPETYGLFVGLQEGEQFVARTPTIYDTEFEHYIENVLPALHQIPYIDPLLESLLDTQITRKMFVLTAEQRMQIYELMLSGTTGKSAIMKAIGITKPDHYKAVSSEVDKIITMAKRVTNALPTP